LIYVGIFLPFLEYELLEPDIYNMEKLTPEQIKQKINELVYLEIPKLNKTELKLLRKTRYKDPDDIDPDDPDEEIIEEIYPEVIQDDANITYPGEIKGINYQRVPCSDCGQPCRNRKTEIKYYPNSPKPHWREHCRTCDTSRNPWTGEMNIPGQIAHDVYTAYERESPNSTRTSKYQHFKIKRNES